jgi:hypothetical protein
MFVNNDFYIEYNVFNGEYEGLWVLLRVITFSDNYPWNATCAELYQSLTK